MVRPGNVPHFRAGDDAPNQLEATLRDVIVVGGVTKHHAVLADGRRVAAAAAGREGAPGLVPREDGRP